MKKLVHLTLGRGMIIFLTLLALGLGGATEIWEQAVLALLAGTLILLAPPKRFIGPVPYLLMAAQLVISLCAFMPAAWFGAAPWRSRLTDEIHLSLGPLRTPQPWLTLQACCLLFSGLVWTGYLLSQRWTSEMRLQAARLLVLGVALLAAAAIAAFSLDFHIPLWNQEENRGWFPNRNQTADVLALCAVINYAMIFDCLRKGRKSLYLWICTLAVLDAALVISYSRAGILMFFGGITLWHLWPVKNLRGRNTALKWTVLSVALVFVMLTFFLLYGGRTLERFDKPLQSAQDNNFRWAIQQDALHFSRESPWLGVGLGNFEALFASARQASVNADRAIHPESDWLWSACELGWLAPVIFLAGIGWWLRRCLPFQAKSGESLRRALTVAGLLFVLHGLVDVSAHRLGSLMVALLVFSLALPGSAFRDGDVRPLQLYPAFRTFALMMLLIGAWWLGSTQSLLVPPTTARLEQLEAQIDDALRQNQMTRMESLATEGLGIAPLSWHFYFQRAYAEVFQPGKLAHATGDFMAARMLEAKWVKPCFDEGATWLAAGQPDLCMDAWSEALRRAGPPEEALNLYREMLALARGNEMVKSDLLDLAGDRIEYQIVFLDFASTDETKKVIGQMLARDPDLHTLDADRRGRLFEYWWNQGDRAQLVTALTAHPDWLDSGWIFLAQSYAAQKDYHGAWTILAQCAPAPEIPAVKSARSLADLQSDFYDQADNFAAGLLLYFAQLQQGHLEDAISTLRAMEKDKNCPKYVYYLEAKLWASKQQWELAWTAWWTFHQSTEMR